MPVEASRRVLPSSHGRKSRTPAACRTRDQPWLARLSTCTRRQPTTQRPHRRRRHHCSWQRHLRTTADLDTGSDFARCPDRLRRPTPSTAQSAEGSTRRVQNLVAVCAWRRWPALFPQESVSAPLPVVGSGLGRSDARRPWVPSGGFPVEFSMSTGRGRPSVQPMTGLQRWTERPLTERVGPGLRPPEASLWAERA